MKIKALLIVVCCLPQAAFSQNPLISHVYAADPSAHVWPTDPDTVYLYTSHDEPGSNNHWTMFSYHVFSSKDLVNWIDHGRVFSLDDADWTISHAWAPDAVYWNEKYYLVYCPYEKETGKRRVGLAVSDFPQGPFKDAGFIEDVPGGQDPAVFIDDGIPYLVWGAGKHCHIGELTSDLKRFKKETFVDLTDQTFEIFEGPWIHKYNDQYYLSYPALSNGVWPQEMYYAVSDNVLGPYVYKGCYIPHFLGASWTNHGSIVQFKGDWIAFHHAMIVSEGISESRNLMADYLYYNEDGTIKEIIPSPLGLLKEGQEAGNTVIWLEAENAPMQGGKIASCEIEDTFADYSGTGYVTGFDIRHDYVEVIAQVAKDMSASLKIRISSEEDVEISILVGNTLLNGMQSPTKLKTTDSWRMLDLGEVPLRAGDNRIRVAVDKNEGERVKIDYFLVDPL